MIDPELETLISLFGEDEGRERFRERQLARIQELKAENAKLKLHIRTGTEFYLDSLRIERRNLNNQKRH